MEIFKGEFKDVTLPSGMEITIREQNGEDDAVLSRVKDVLSGDSIGQFLAGIVQQVDGEVARLTAKDVLDWKSSDINYALLSSRIHSLGEELEFRYKCTNDACRRATPMTEPLNEFLNDFSNPNMDAEDKAKPYPMGKAKSMTVTLSTGKRVSFDFMTGAMELALTKKDQQDINRNDELTGRNIRVVQDGKEIPISGFNIFSSREMREIRTAVKENDPQFPMIMRIKCPHCGNVDDTPLSYIPDFFFPLGA